MRNPLGGGLASKLSSRHRAAADQNDDDELCQACMAEILRRCELPAATVPREHGNAVTQSPALDTNERPLGVGSATLTAAASDVPLLVTMIV